MTFKYLLIKKIQFLAKDRIEDINITFAPNLKKGGLSKLFAKYKKQMSFKGNEEVDYATIKEDREGLKTMLKTLNQK